MARRPPQHSTHLRLRATKMRKNARLANSRDAASSTSFTLVEDPSSEPQQDEGEDEHEADDDVDVPRVSKWIDEQELSEDHEKEQDPAHAGSNEDGHPALEILQSDLSTLPFGALRRAQQTLVDDGDVTESDGEEYNGQRGDTESVSETETQTVDVNGGREQDKVKRKIISRRSNKHAPTEVTSKKPVTRRRTVVEVKTVQPRDPRFMPLAGELSEQKFKAQYGFIAELHKNELATLRDNLRRARRILASSPSSLREDREREVTRLELAVIRMESTVDRDKRESIEQEALSRAQKAEQMRRKEGKGNWWMKRFERQEVLKRARYEAIAAAGGNRAVKKAVEKRQKKIAQKERRSRPFARGHGVVVAGFNSTKRPSSSVEEKEGRKRRRI